jgi:nickel superoxide dismutase
MTMKSAKMSFQIVLLLVVLLLLTPHVANSHCEIPCGIYGDTARITLLYEHIDTIEKSMRQIAAISRESGPNWNQLVRWVSNKEKHADEVQHIVTQYFMTQRVKPTSTKYVEKLTTLHKMLIAAMKAKQTTDLSHTKELRALVGEFAKIYLTEDDLRHLRAHHHEGK